MLHWQGRRRTRRREGELAGETEAFLAGKIALWLDRTGRPVPSWAWINWLAHASLDDLAAVGRISWNRRQSRAWAGGFLMPLSIELALRSRGDDRQLSDLQRRFLWPLEVRLLNGAGPAVSGPLDMLSLVRTALGDGPGRTAPMPGEGYPAPPLGRNLGNGRLNRIAFQILGPANVARRPARRPAAGGAENPP